MSDALYGQIVNNGLGLSSPSLKVVEHSIVQLNSVSAALNRLPISQPPLLGLTQEWIDSAQNTIHSSANNLTNAKQIIQTKCDNVLTHIQLASSVKRLEDFVGCSDLSNLTGSIMGELDPMLNAISSNAQAQLDLIDQYAANMLDKNALMGQFDALGIYYQNQFAAIMVLFEKETEWFNDMLNKVTSSSLAKSVYFLWQDPCAQAVLNNTLPPEVKNILNQGGL